VAGGLHSGVEEIFEAEGEAIAVAVGEISAAAIVAVVVATLDAAIEAVAIEAAVVVGAIEAVVVVGAILAAEGEEDAIVSEGAVEMISDEGVAAVILVEAEVVAISDEEGATFVAEATSDVGVETFEEEAALGMIIGTAKALLQTKAGEISTHSRARHNRTNGISHLPRTPAEINFLKDAFHRKNKINLGTNKVDSHQTNSTIRQCLRSSNNRVVEITHPRRRRNPTGREAVFQILRRSKRTHINSNKSLGLTSNNNSNNRASMRMRASKISKHLAGIINRTKIAWRAIAASRTSRRNSSNPHLRLLLRKPLQCNQW